MTGEAPANICASEPARFGLDRDIRRLGPRALSAEALSSMFWMPRSCLPPGLIRSFAAAGPVGVDEKSALGPDGGRDPELGADIGGRSGVCMGGRECGLGPEGWAEIWLRRSGWMPDGPLGAGGGGGGGGTGWLWRIRSG